MPCRAGGADTAPAASPSRAHREPCIDVRRSRPPRACPYGGAGPVLDRSRGRRRARVQGLDAAAGLPASVSTRSRAARARTRRHHRARRPARARRQRVAHVAEDAGEQREVAGAHALAGEQRRPTGISYVLAARARRGTRASSRLRRAERAASCHANSRPHRTRSVPRRSHSNGRTRPSALTSRTLSPTCRPGSRSSGSRSRGSSTPGVTTPLGAPSTWYQGRSFDRRCRSVTAPPRTSSGAAAGTARRAARTRSPRSSASTRSKPIAASPADGPARVVQAELEARVHVLRRADALADREHRLVDELRDDPAEHEARRVLDPLGVEAEPVPEEASACFAPRRAPRQLDELDDSNGGIRWKPHRVGVAARAEAAVGAHAIIGGSPAVAGATASGNAASTISSGSS